MGTEYMGNTNGDSAFNKRTIAAALANYIDAGSIVAGSAGLSLWVSYLKLSDTQIGLLGALSANAISAAVGALLGGYLADKVGRKAVYTNSMLVYALGICLVLFGVNFPMLLSGYMIIGLSVGADITASWTIIAENAPKKNRARHCGVAQVAWAAGAVVVLLLSVLVGDLGLLGNKIVFAHLLVIALITYILRIRLPESDAWQSKNQPEDAQSEKPAVLNKTSYFDLLKPMYDKKHTVFDGCVPGLELSRRGDGLLYAIHLSAGRRCICQHGKPFANGTLYLYGIGGRFDLHALCRQI